MDRPKILWYLLLGFVFSIPLSSFVSTRLLIVTLVFSLFVKKNSDFLRSLFKSSWDVYLFLLVLALGLLYTADLTSGFGVLETSFSLLAVPLILATIKNFQTAKIYSVFYAFSLGLLLACLLCFGNAVIAYFNTHDNSVFFSYQFTEIIGSHPTYLAYFIIFSLTAGLYLIHEGTFQLSKAITFPILLFFFLTLMCTGGNTAFISLLLIFSFFVLKFFLGEASRDKSILIVITFMMVSLFLANVYDYWGNDLANTDYWERSALWKAAIVANPNPVFGVGTGDYRAVLNEYYRTHGLANFAEENFNSHNQFIQVYFSNGLIGLAILLIMFVRPLASAVRLQDTLGKLLFFPFIIYGMNEVFLGRYQGVVFFALVHAILTTVYSGEAPVGRAPGTTLANTV